MKQFFAGVILLIFAQLSAFSQDVIVNPYTGPVTFSQYQEFAPDLSVTNAGIVSINRYFYTAIYLSTDNQWQASDLALSSITISSLGAGQAFTGKSTNSFINAPAGNYYLIIKGDHQAHITETDESNNILIVPGVIVTAPDVDFTLTSFSLDKSVYTQNSLVKPSYVLTNNGSTNSGGQIVTKFVLSSDATINQGDITFRPDAVILTGSDNIPSNQYLGFALPAVSNGSYYIIAQVDADERFEETNENNNLFTIPITIQSSTIDLQIFSASGSNASGSLLMTMLYIKNNGTTGVAGYDVGVELRQDGTPGFNYTPSLTSNEFDSYLGPGESKSFLLQFPVNLNLAPGTYYPVFKVNFTGQVAESNSSNNTFTDYSGAVIITPPPSPSVTLNSVTVPGMVDDTDQQISVNLSLKNSGNTSNFNQNYTILVKNTQNLTVHSQQANIAINFGPGQTASKVVTLNLSSPLSAGTYKFSVSCTSSCYTTPSVVNANVAVVVTQYTVAGSVQGEEGTPITKGKLFLYQKEGSDDARFIQKIVPYEGSGFSFQIDSNPHTLYFIPDPEQYPMYVPTIYGKTVALGVDNFFTASSNMNVTFDILHVNSLPSGPGIINGYVSSNNPSGRTLESNSDIPVILLSSAGQVVGITHTDKDGFYEFKKLPRNTYQLLISLELDTDEIMNPFTVDINEKNMIVNLLLKDGGISPEQTQLFLPQSITFDELPTHQFNDDSITPNATSDIGLPIEYVSSDDRIAAIVDGKIVIKSVGTVTITAHQAGNTFYLPANSQRSLIIKKADQLIVLNAPIKKTFGDKSFAVESTSSSGLAVTLSSSDPGIASVHNNIVTIHQAGEVDIVAVQEGNELYNAAASVRTSLLIDKATQTISFDPLLSQQSDIGSFSLAATSTSGLDISFVSTDDKIVSVKGNTATVHQAGTVNIIAHQAGDKNYHAAEDVVRSVVVNLILGIEQIEIAKLVYPNPTIDFVFIRIAGLRNVEVYDVTGRRRDNVAWSENKIDFSQSEAGVYVVKLFFNNQTAVTRIIKY